MGKKDKKNKKEKVTKANTTLPTVAEGDDVKEVLQLFNKIEELVVDGDPRIREALSRKPGIQNLLRDDSSLYGLTPRSIIGQFRTDQGLLLKEGTNTSFQSQQVPYGHQLNSRTQVPLRNASFIRSPRKNILVPPIAIPEHSTLGDTFSNGYHAATIKQHPDGTVESMRRENPIAVNVQVPAPTNTRTIVRHREPTMEKIRYITKPVKQVTVKPKRLEESTTPRYHSFVYDTGDEKTKVQIQMPSEQSFERQREPINTKAVEEQVSNLSAAQTSVHSEAVQDIFDLPTRTEKFQMEESYVPMYHNNTVQSKEYTTAVHSTVIGEEGGSLECFGCRLQVPKNAVAKKFLLRLSILGISDTPHKNDRIFNRTQNNLGSTMMAITPTINVSPIDVEFQKPVTIQLPTCIAIHNQSENQQQEQQSELPHGDIKADDVVIKIRSKQTRDAWTESDVDVFRSSDSIIFNTRELGDMCGFYKEDVEEKQALNKRLAIFLFKSDDNRKKQFVSMLITEELPHVIQRGVESMPQWLKYTDSCSNVILPEGKNLVLYIEAMDRTQCQTDANKIEIPWENLWHLECIIRKHIHVNLLKRDVPTSVQVFIDDGKRKLQAEFIWKRKYQTIVMPDLMTVDDGTAQYLEDVRTDQDQLDQELLKKVTWKPDTPVSKFVTNKELLSYASM